MKKNSVFVVYLALLAGLFVLNTPYVSGVTFNQNCTSGNFEERVYNGSDLIFNNSFVCPYGCSVNGLECALPAEPDIFFPIAIAFSIIAGIFAYLSYHVNEEHWPLQILFIISALTYIILVAGMLAGFHTLTTDDMQDVMITAYWIGIMITTAVFVYMIYLIVKSIMERILKHKQVGKPFKVW